MHFLKRRYWLKKPDTSFSIAKFVLAAMLFLLGLNIVSSFRAEASTPTPSTWNLLAAGERTAVFPADSANQNNLILNNGSYFYNLSTFGNFNQGSFGFSPNSTITLDLADVRDSGAGSGQWGLCDENTTGPLRMSWKRSGASGENVPAGYRIGCSIGVAGIRAVYQSMSLPTYYPSGPQRSIGTSTLTNGGWTQCYIGDFQGTVTYSTITNACTGTYILLAGYVGSSSGPTVSTFSSSTTTPRNDSIASYSVVLSQSVTGLTSDDFENAGTATECSYSLTGSGTTYTLSISACSDGTIQPRIKANSVSGSAFDGPASAATATSTITKDSVAPTATATTETITAGNSGVFSIGSTGPGGGKVFHVSSSGFACGPTLSQTCHYLEAAPTSGASAWSDGSRNTVWSGNTNTTTGATGTAIGTGYKNTLAIISQNNTSNRAATNAQSYRGPNNFSDWYLPSKDELTLIYSRKSDLSIASGTSNDYWSSSEASATTAGYHYMGSADWPYTANKSDGLYVRAIRAFARNHIVVRSSEAGSAYLVNVTVNVSNLTSISGAADNLQNSVSVSTANTDTNLSIAGLISGTYKLYTVDGVGNLSAASTNTITIKPARPDTPDLKASSDLGTSDTDNSTSDDTPTFDVSSIEIGTEVILTATPSSGNPVTCSFVAAGTSGSCTFTSLSNSTYSIAAVQSFGGVNSDTSTALANVVINKTTISTPATPDLASASDLGRSNSDDITSDNTPTISAVGTFAGTATVTAAKVGSDSVTCTVSSGACTLGTLSDGTWSITVKDQDTAGNSATSSALLITIDTVAPSASAPTSPIWVTPGTDIQIQSPEIGTAQLRNTFSATDRLSSVVNIDVANTSYTVQVPAAFNNQCYQLYVYDLAGNVLERKSTDTSYPHWVCTAPVIAPTSLVATPGNGSVSISFTQPAPTDSNAYPISNYYYSLDGTNFTALSPASVTSPISISGLTNGTAYSITLKAYYGPSGNRSFSNPSAAVSLTLPAAPTVNANDAPDNLASPGSFKVGDTLTNKMTFNGAPTPTLSYQYFRCPTNIGVLASDYISSGCVDIPGATSSTYTLTGDDVGKYMGVKITATNSSGSLVLTPKRNTLVTAASPGAPTSVVTTITGSTTATVSFTAPASNGGSSITGYTVTSTPSGAVCVVGANSTTYNCTGLAASRSYTFKVKATNSIGSGSDSSPSSSAVTLVAPTLTVLKDESNNANDTPISLLSGTLTDPCASNSYYTITFSSGSCNREPTNYSSGNVNADNMFVDTNRSVFLNLLQPINSFTFDACCVDRSVYVLVQYEDSNPSSFYVGNSGFVSYLLTANASSVPSTRYQISFADGRLIKKIGLGFNSDGSSSSGDITIYDNFGFSVAPLATSVSVSSKSLTAGTAATSFTPITASGGGSSKTFSISPSLPSGLSLTTSTGAITGTPTGASASTSYTVSVTDGSSTSTATFSLGVNAALSSSAGTVPSGVYKDVAVTAFTPVSFSGGTSPVTYSVSPSLPAGLSLNTSTGVISGTATGTDASTTYTVTATDANGASEASTFAFAVTNQPTAPGAPTIGAATATGQTTATVAFTAPASTGGAAITNYTVTASPGGVTATGSSSPITVTGLTAGTAYTFSITATNAAGLTSTSSSPSSSITTESAPIQNNNNGGGGGGGGAPAPAPEPAPEPVCNAACVAAQNAAEKAAADKVAAEKAAAEKLAVDKAAAVAIAEKTKVEVNAAATVAAAAVEKATAAAAAKVEVDTVAAAVSTVVSSTKSTAENTNKITNEAAASISSAPAAATKAASTASANTKANSAAAQVRAAATAAQIAATSSQVKASAAPEIAFGSSNNGTAAASQAAAKANAAARAGKAAANEVAAIAEAKAVESKATATALQNEANAAIAEAIAEQKVASELAVEAKAATDKANTATAEKIAAIGAAKTAAETLVTLLTEKVAIAEKVATAASEEVRAEAQKSLDVVNIKITENERAVAETVSKADTAIAAQTEAIKVAEATKASAEAQLAKVKQLNAVVPVKAAAAVRAASVAAVDANVATAAKAAAAKIPSKAVIAAPPGVSTDKNSTRATISGLKPGQKVKVTVNVKPKP